MQTADYVRLLHPLGSWGKPTALIKIRETAHSRTWTLEDAPLLAETCADETAYVTLNRFHGPRRGDNLAEINAIYLDLDPHLLPPGASHDPLPWAQLIEARACGIGLPSPSIVTATGRGIASIWLLRPLPSQAVRRWQAAQRALIHLYRDLGADPSCCDAARVFRLPGTTNSKVGREVRVIGGTGERSSFDLIEDAIYTAAGRPKRSEFTRRRRTATRAAQETTRRGGLTQAERHTQIVDDLDRIAAAHGGRIPPGLRNTWLHLRSTCLTHMPVTDIEAEIRAQANRVVPDLPAREVDAIIRTALRQAGSRTGGMAGRYHYAGATVAQRLDVGDAMARALRLRQVISEEERRYRKADRERDRRRASGAAERGEWLSEHDISAKQPWKAEGISRATWYRRKAMERADQTDLNAAQNE